ncbi:WD repeat-containing protein 97 isoform X2 [Alosa sapidissima]|uniref:WD repeat-containing protein 97 isoform X2 n=1 Tax=Alosa sapidissima TaxID=34773 RepID=UPI001C0A375D|nr:WD repeat-containing protein 97 isoform X2 [Alosa sapidissima]
MQHTVFTHGLQHLRHVPCNRPPRHMTCGEGVDGFISLHDDSANSSFSACFYHTDGSIWEPSPSCHSIPYLGLTSTQLPDRVVGWGPGAVVDLLDGQLRPLAQAMGPLDVRTCMATDNPTEVVTAGEGNVCLWCLSHMVSKVQVGEGLETQVFTQLALAPRHSKYGHRAFAVYGSAVTVVDLKKGVILERKNLHQRDITAITYCSQMDYLVTASRDVTIRVWGPDWELKVAFVGHSGLVTSLVCCPRTGLLLSCSLDLTLRCWSLEEGDQVQKISVEGIHPPLAIGGPAKGGAFFTFSEGGVDFWNINSLYQLHCKLGGDFCGPVRQMIVPPCPPPYPARVLCIHGDRDVTLISAVTGAILTGLTVGCRVLCAEYCLLKETILILTEDGVMLTASALTNPITVLDKWTGESQEAKQWEDKERDGQNSGPGPASCMVLYRSLADRKRSLQEWRNLQELRGMRAKKQKYVNDSKNRFLVMLGHRGGYVTVLKLHTQKVQYTTPAHKGQNITIMQAHPETSYLLTAGEDKSVLVWRVFPYAEECLGVHLNVFCGQPPLHMALLGPLLALTFQEPESATYSLAYYHMDNKRRLDHPPKQDHLGCITGLTVNSQHRVFASCSEDGTVRIWNEENHLVRILELFAELDCLAFIGYKEDLLLGIRGNLYYISFSQILPQDLPLQPLCCERFDPVPDLPIPLKASCTSKMRSACSILPEQDQDVTVDPELAALQARNRDLEALQQGELEIRRKPKKRPRALRKRIRKEAFDAYMKLIYKEPVKIDVPEVDTFDLNFTMFPPKPCEERPGTPPTFKEGFFSNQAKKAANNAAQPHQERHKTQISIPEPYTNMGFIPNSALIDQLWPRPEGEDILSPSPEEAEEWKLQEWDSLSSETKFWEYDETEGEESDEEERVLFLHSPKPEITVSPLKPPTPPPVVEESSAIVEKKTRQTLPPVKDIKPRPRKVTTPRAPSPPPARTPSPTLPEFLVQFLEEVWFKDIFPDVKRIPASLRPDDFVKQLLEFMKGADTSVKMHLMTALLTLSQQGVLKDSGLVSRGLVACLSHCITPNMTEAELCFAHEMLNMLVCLCANDSAFMVELLVLMAHKQLDFQKTILSLLQKMGLKEDEIKLMEELNSWQKTVQGQSDIWQGLRKKADIWLNIWTVKYKEQNRALLLLSSGMMRGIPPVDVLNYFCSLPEITESVSSHVKQGRDKDAVMLPRLAPMSKPIYRLGETYSMSRTREPRGIVLPPLTHRPLLLGFTRFLKLPLAQVLLDPFPYAPDPHCLKPSPRRFFMVEQSYVS